MDDAKRAANVLYRYAMAKARFKKTGFWGTDFIGLEATIRRGVNLFGGILIDPKAPRVITADDADNDFFEAIIDGRDDALKMDAKLLNQAREYVLNNGPFPRYPVPEC